MYVVVNGRVRAILAALERVHIHSWKRRAKLYIGLTSVITKPDLHPSQHICLLCFINTGIQVKDCNDTFYHINGIIYKIFT